MEKTFFRCQFWTRVVGGTAISSETSAVKEKFNLTTLSESINNQGSDIFSKYKAKQVSFVSFCRLQCTGPTDKPVAHAPPRTFVIYSVVSALS